MVTMVKSVQKAASAAVKPMKTAVKIPAAKTSKPIKAAAPAVAISLNSNTTGNADARKFVQRFNASLECRRNLKGIARRMYERQVLLGVLTEELTDTNQDVTSPESLADCKNRLVYYNSQDFKNLLQDKVSSASSMSDMQKGALHLLLSLSKGDMTADIAK